MTASWKPFAKRFERERAPRLLAVVASTAALALTACGSAQKVERRSGDHVEVGRGVPSRAYAWYARARYLHRIGELELAEHAYREVLSLDPKSGAAYAGLGAVHCAASREQAGETFARGRRRADEKVPVQVAQGRCELFWGEAERAIASARQAFVREPASPEVNALLVDALRSAGKDAEATRFERAQWLYGGTKPPRSPSMPTRAAVDRALQSGDLPLAEALSLETMTQSELAVRALAFGHVEFARELAGLIALAAPDDRTAVLVLTLTRGASEEGAPPSEISDADAPAPDAPAPHALGLCLLAEHVRSHLGQEATGTYLTAVGPGAVPATLGAWKDAGDPLLAACARRLARALTMSSTADATSSADRAP